MKAFPKSLRMNTTKYRAVLTAIAPGQVIVTARLKRVKHSIAVNIWTEHFPPDHRVRRDSFAFGSVSPK